MRTTVQIVSLCAGALLLMSNRASAEPGLLPVQGVLTDDTGAPIDGTRRLTFTLFDAAADGTALYTDDHPAVEITGGHFVVYLGSQAGAELDLALFRDQRDVWLEVVIDGSEVVTPRTQLGAVPYAGHAQYCGDAESLGGLAPDAYQSRVTGSCSPGSYVRAIAEDGSVTCDADVDTQRNISYQDWFLQNGESATLGGFTSANAVCFVGRIDVFATGAKCQAYLQAGQWLAYTEGSVYCNIRCLKW